ncbi:putative 7-deoxyloganetic acid glucosyltransferase [Dioscorea sansibarensis]
METSSSAHVLIFPFPAQGHVTPMLHLADLLSFSGLRITFINTEHTHCRLLRHSPSLLCLAGRGNFRFRIITDGLPGDDRRLLADFFSIQESIRTCSREQYKELLTQEIDGWPPVTCVIADGVLLLANEVADEVGVPTLVFRTSGPCSCWVYQCTPRLIQQGVIPFLDECDMDAVVYGVEGMEGLLRRRDLPSFMRMAKSIEDNEMKFISAMNTHAVRGKGLILNSFEALDPALLDIMRSYYPTIYTIGPLHLHIRSLNLSCEKEVCNNASSTSLLQENRTCMAWLDNQPDKSVVYVSFGSVAEVSREELMEFWEGLVDSGHRFLWVVRQDMVVSQTEEMNAMKIPEKIEKGLKERGCIVEWVPQEEVLAHRAVGCFLTHSGWNSTLESVVAGVPMICRPFFADQLINSRFTSEVWRIGVDMKDKFDKETVKRLVKEVMEGESALKLRDSATRMAKLARKSVEECGTSRANLESLVRYIKSTGSDTS